MLPNSLVKSLAGRDKGEWFAVISCDGEYAFIANGGSRPLSRPKRKKLRHLEISKTLLREEDLATDRKLRRAIRELEARQPKGGE